jgi:hypothetical protein
LFSFYKFNRLENKDVKVIHDEMQTRRVIIYRRETGAFYYEQEYFSEPPAEMCRIPPGRSAAGFYDRREKAESDARTNIEWLISSERS